MQRYSLFTYVRRPVSCSGATEDCVHCQSEEVLRRLMNTNQTIIIILLSLVFEENSRASNSSTSPSTPRVSFINSGSTVEVELGSEAVLECLIQHLANNHLVREIPNIAL